MQAFAQVAEDVLVASTPPVDSWVSYNPAVLSDGDLRELYTRIARAREGGSTQPLPELPDAPYRKPSYLPGWADRAPDPVEVAEPARVFDDRRVALRRKQIDAAEAQRLAKDDGA